MIARFRARRLLLPTAILGCGLALLFAGRALAGPAVHGSASTCHKEAGNAASAAPNVDAEQASTDAAFDFLKAQMDLYDRSRSIYSEPGASSYHASGKLGDVEDISAVSDYRGNAHSGHYSLRIDYQPREIDRVGWVSLYFLHPDGNWGQLPGAHLSGATKLIFWSCADAETRVEFSIGGIRKADLPYADSLERRSTGVVFLQPTWRRYEIDLSGADLSSVIGGFAVTIPRQSDSSARSIFLDDIFIERLSSNEPRLVQSYLPTDCDKGGEAHSAQTYDQALVLLAFLARGQAEDLKRAKLIARALVKAQQSDRTFKDGRLRNAYAADEPIDRRTNTARIAEEYNRDAKRYLEDENAAGSDTGNMAWVALALVQAHDRLPKSEGSPYLTAAASIARWIVANTKVNDSLGGFSAGMQGFERASGIPEGQSLRTYRSTEHNIDLEALFEHLAAAAGRETEEGRQWIAQGAHARTFVNRMRNDDDASARHFWTGTQAGTEINKHVVPLDVQTWAVLRSREPATDVGALTWALKNCTEKGRTDAFDFNCNDGDGAWWEGTAQVAASLRWLKREHDAAPILERLRAAQLKAGAAVGALPAASRCGLTTGFDMSFSSGQIVPWLYPNWPHVGATAWFIFATMGVNPFFLARRM